MSALDAVRVVIVGAGPAGIRAAETFSAAGIRSVVIDEGERAGGQIYRRPPEGFTRTPAKLYGSEAAKAEALHKVFDTMVATRRVEYHPRSSVIALADGVLDVLGESGREQIHYDRLILATGAIDRLAPVPGWQNPGVYSLGAMQIALKAQGVGLGRQLVLGGSGPLLTLVATQLMAAGAGIAAVLDTSSMRQQFSGLSGMAARPIVMARGILMRTRLAGLYHAGARIDDIEADERGPVAVRWHDRRGRAVRTPCDAVGLGWHLQAETHLADLAGCRFEFDKTWGQWLPCADRMGRAGEGLYLAGDGLRILGADAAEVAGRLAAIACLTDLGLPVPDPAPDLRRIMRYERFARGIAAAFPWPAAMVRTLPDPTVVCRCEAITAGEVREAADYGGGEANRVKALGRAGMGRCQGRYCRLASAELISARVDCTPHAVGRMRGQPPVRPVPIGAWRAGG